jgi:putative ABC transport system ATP-binding protein
VTVEPRGQGETGQKAGDPGPGRGQEDAGQKAGDPGPGRGQEDAGQKAGGPGVDATLIELADVHKIYKVGTEEVRALDGVSFAVRPGEWLGIVGQSGSGKSTLMNILGCLDTPTSGLYRLNGVDVRGLSDNALADLRNKEIGFVFQTFQLLARSTALANVELPLIYRGVSRRERRQMAQEALSKVGLGQRMHHRPNELSGGQRQRVAIARALVGKPSLLLADEPTGNLDSATGEEIIRLFGELHKAGHTILLVTHEPRLAARCPRAVRLSDGKVIADATGEEIAAMQLRRVVGT